MDAEQLAYNKAARARLELQRKEVHALFIWTQVHEPWRAYAAALQFEQWLIREMAGYPYTEAR